MNANMLKSLKEAEAVLARTEAERLSDLPDGHPLKAEVDRQKAVLDGDLSGLPEGHPLRRALLEAKERHERRLQQEAEEGGKVEVRKAKRLDEAKVRRDARKAEDERERVARDAAKSVNAGIDKVLVSMDELGRIVEENERVFVGSHLGRANMLRIRRLVQAAVAGLEGSRLRAGRM